MMMMMFWSLSLPPPLPNQIHNKNFQTNTEDTYKN